MCNTLFFVVRNGITFLFVFEKKSTACKYKKKKKKFNIQLMYNGKEIKYKENIVNAFNVKREIIYYV